MNKRKMALLMVLLVLSLSCLFPIQTLADSRSYYEITSGTAILLGSETRIEVIPNPSNYLEEWEASEKAIEAFAQKDVLLKANNAEFLGINGNKITFDQLKNLAQITSTGENFYQGYGSLVFAFENKLREGYTYATSIKETENGLLIDCFFLDLEENKIYKLKLEGQKTNTFELKNKIQVKTDSETNSTNLTQNSKSKSVSIPFLLQKANKTQRPDPTPDPGPDPTPTPDPEPDPPTPRNPGLDDPGSIIPGATI